MSPRATIEGILTQKLPLGLRWIALSISLLIAGTIGYVCLADVEELVTVPGALAWSSPKIVISSPDLAIVESEKINVAETVKKGQVLATLRSLDAEADHLQLQFEAAISLAKIGILSLDQAGIDMPTEAPSSYLAAVEAIGAGRVNAAEIWTEQWELYARRRASYEQELSAIEANIAKLMDQLQSLRINVESLRRRVPVHDEIEAIKKKLLDKGVGSRLAYLEASEARMSAESAVTTAERDFAEVVTNLEREKGQRHVRTTTWHSQIASDLDEARRQSSLSLARLQVAAGLSELTNIVAPADAVVLERAERAAGSVVQKGEHLFTMLATDGHYRVQLMIPPKDIARIKGNEIVRIKFESLPFQRHGYLEGKIKSISSDVVPMPGATKEETTPVYIATATIDPLQKLRNVPDNFEPLPGMPLTAEIIVGKRRLATYFTYPLTQVAATALREGDLGPAPTSAQ